MADVTVCARQGDVTRSAMAQKRPLSIITENDSDDPEAIDSKKYHDTADSSGKENASFCENHTPSSTISTNSEIISEPPNFISGSKSLSDSLTINHKSSLAGARSSARTSNSIKSTSSAYHPESNVSLLVSRREGKSESNGIKNSDDSSSKSLIERSKLPLLIISEVKNPSQEHYFQSVKPAHNGVSDSSATQISTPGWSNSGGDGQSLMRVREATERLNLLSSLSSTSPSTSSSAVSSKFGHRMRTQSAAPRTLHQVKSSGGQNLQQLSVNSNGVAPLVVSMSLVTSPDSDSSVDNNNSIKFLSDISENSSLGQSSINRSIFPNSNLNSTKLSAYFSRRMSNESTGSMSESDLSDGENCSDDSQSSYLSYFRRLKETTDRLRLSTRRPSIMLWRQQYMECQGSSLNRSNQNEDGSDDRLTLDRKQRIDLALEWLRNQLQEMRSQDQNLARQLLAIRNDIYKLKLQRSTEEHQELIDDFHFELQELQELSDVLDLPLPEYGDNPLKHIGVTRLNISERRFSAC